MPDRVCVIIPFFNGDEFIGPCVESINANNYHDIHICIVNNSTAASRVHEVAKKYSNVKVVDTTPGIGYGKANNIGAEYALSIQAKFMVILNQDSIIDTNCIPHLIAPFYSDFEVAISAPLSYTYDFSKIESHFIRWYLTQCPDLFRDLLDSSPRQFYTMREVSGSCFAIRSEFVKKFGLFDPLYFMYMEDMDLCRKVRFLQQKIVLTPSAKIAHAHSNTSEDKDKKDEINTYSRESRGVYLLKEVNKSFLFNLSKFIRVNLEDYINLLTTLKLKAFFYTFWIDLKVIPKLTKISRSRKREMSLNKLNVNKLTELV